MNDWREYLRFRGRIIEQLDTSLYPPEWLDAQVYTGNFQFLSSGDSAILWSYRTYPSGVREAHGEYAIGKVPTIVGVLIPQFEAIAQAKGCSFAVIQSREGWEKVMKPYNYAKFQTAIRKVL